MVDEAQDLSTKQYEFIGLLKNNGISNILLVGDFDQNIYSWRGARTDLFKSFYLRAKKYSLGINYRSTPAIVNYSKKLIENNTDRININKDMMEEERRLMYVGITRSKEHLYITASPFFGYSAVYANISRFVKEAGIKINDLSSYDSLHAKNPDSDLCGIDNCASVDVKYWENIYDNSSYDSKDNGKIITNEIKNNVTGYNMSKPENFNFYIEIILTALLGWLGAHCFYKKQYIKAITYMLTFGLFGIGWLTDLTLLFIKINKTSKK